uniref:RRM domain-containing protein n=1 Tax=Romanomermis culicivorax TaxID=13658 RepID=A0A915K8R9_ROMCU
MSSDSDSDREARVRNSSYYLEKFGSRSPEEYKSLRITNIDPKIGEHDLDNVLRKLFSRYGEMHCKVVNPRDVHERIAYVNFDFGEDARDASDKAGNAIYPTNLQFILQTYE